VGLDHLLEALERDANAQVERLLGEARAEADRLTAAGIGSVERRRREAAALRERSRQQEVERAVTLARRDARRAVLESRACLVERVIAAARAELPAAASGPANRTRLPAAVASALMAVGGAPAVIRCPARLASEMERLPPADGVSIVVDPGAGSGFRLATADGAVEVDETLETRLERRRPELTRHLLARLEVES
jgi:vacuolar-type H+-ATPase subunit E/Vma4